MFHPNTKHLLAVAILMAFSYSMPQVQEALAQTAVTSPGCPVGYICEPVATQPVGCPVGYTCRPARTPVSNTNSVSVTNTSIKSTAVETGTNQIVQANVTFTFTINNLRNTDIYLSKDSHISFATTSTGLTLPNQTVLYGGDWGITTNPGTVSGDTLNGCCSYGYYVVPAGSSRTFVVNGMIDFRNMPTGLKSLQIIAIRYGVTASNLTSNTITAGLEGLKILTSTGNVSPTTPVTNVPTISILSPKGGERLYANTDYKIVWRETRQKGNTPVYMVVLTSENGKDLLVDKYTASDHCSTDLTTCVYIWHTPSMALYQAQLSIYDIENDPSSSLVARSGYFTVIPSTTTGVPVITSVSPTSGVAGSKITVYGKNFDLNTKGGIGLEIGGKAYGQGIAVNILSPNQLTATLPNNMAPGNYTLKINGVPGVDPNNYLYFTVTSNKNDPIVTIPTPVPSPIAVPSLPTNPPLPATVGTNCPSKNYDLCGQVADLYRNLLGREADQQGWDYWVSTGMTAQQIQSTFMNTVEYTVKQRIIAVYQSLLNRAPSNDELHTIYSAAEKQGYSMDYVRATIMSTTEYQQLHPTQSGTVLNALINLLSGLVR